MRLGSGRVAAVDAAGASGELSHKRGACLVHFALQASNSKGETANRNTLPLTRPTTGSLLIDKIVPGRLELLEESVAHTKAGSLSHLWRQKSFTFYQDPSSAPSLRIKKYNSAISSSLVLSISIFSQHSLLTWSCRGLVPD